MRGVLRVLAVGLVAAAVPAAAFGVLLLRRGGYESAAPHFVGSIFVAGAAAALLAAIVLGRLSRRR